MPAKIRAFAHELQHAKLRLSDDTKSLILSDGGILFSTGVVFKKIFHTNPLIRFMNNIKKSKSWRRDFARRFCSFRQLSN